MKTVILRSKWEQLHQPGRSQAWLAGSCSAKKNPQNKKKTLIDDNYIPAIRMKLPNKEQLHQPGHQHGQLGLVLETNERTTLLKSECNCPAKNSSTSQVAGMDVWVLSCNKPETFFFSVFESCRPWCLNLKNVHPYKVCCLPRTTVAVLQLLRHFCPLQLQPVSERVAGWAVLKKCIQGSGVLFH